MGKSDAMFVAVVAIAIGAVLGYVGIDMMLDAGSFAEAEQESRSGLLGMGGGSSSSASVNTPAWVGLVLAMVGAGAFLFGLRALFVASRDEDAGIEP